MGKRNAAGFYDNPATEAEKTHNRWLEIRDILLPNQAAKPMDDYYEYLISGEYAFHNIIHVPRRGMTIEDFLQDN